MKLSRGARECLSVMKTKWFKGKSECWPRRSKIAKELGVCVRQAARYLAELKDKNVLSVIRRPNTSAVYRLCAEMSSPMSSPNVLSILTEKSLKFNSGPAQSAPNPGPNPWCGATTDYFTGQRRRQEEPKATVAAEDREMYRRARQAFPFANHTNLLEAVAEMKLEAMRKPPQVERGELAAFLAMAREVERKPAASEVARDIKKAEGSTR